MHSTKALLIIFIPPRLLQTIQLPFFFLYKIDQILILNLFNLPQVINNGHSPELIA